MSQFLQYYKSFQGGKNNNAAPTFEDLSIDDNLSELERTVRYCKSTIALQRLVHVKLLADVSKTVGVESTCENILPVLEAISVDFEPAIRCHLCDQIAMIAKYCVEDGGDKGYQMVLDAILPILARLLEDDKVDVRHAASAALVTVAQYIQPPDLGQHILTIILQLAHEDDNEEMRMTASELLNLLAEHLGFDLCKQFVIPEVVSLAEDPVFRVRKSTALNLHNVCKVGGEYELFERLMPAFVRLSKDDMYRVRRACAESLCEISKHVSDDIRAGVLVEIFLRLAQDPSKLVKQSVLQQSGMFITTLPPRVINSVILDHYCNMVNSPTGDMVVDAELRQSCAYSFPGVLQTVGAERWPELRQVYHALVQSSDTNVKQTLALSLHEVARIIGTKLAEEELVAVFEEMIQDIEVVRMGVIKYLAHFLRLLSMPCRVSYLPLLDDILQSSSPFNWRLRKALAKQLPELVTLPPPQNVFSTLFPLAMTLLQDPVAQVRLESYKGVARMIAVIQPGYVPSYFEEQEDGTFASPLAVTEEEGTQYLTGVSRAINALVYGETYQQRQTWAELSTELVKTLPEKVFEKYFLSGVFQLASDPVLNVRVSVAEMLSGWEPTHPAPWEDDASPWKWLLDRPDIRHCIQRLSRDDNDVYIAMRKLKPYFPEIEFESISCRGLKQAPWGELPVGNSSSEAADMDQPTSFVLMPSAATNGGSPSSQPSPRTGDDDKCENEDDVDTLPAGQNTETFVRQVKVARRCTPSPTKDVLNPEDILPASELPPSMQSNDNNGEPTFFDSVRTPGDSAYDADVDLEPESLSSPCHDIALPGDQQKSTDLPSDHVNSSMNNVSTNHCDSHVHDESPDMGGKLSNYDKYETARAISENVEDSY